MRLYFSFILVFLTLFGCDASRTNPFDPNASNYVRPYNTTLRAVNKFQNTNGIENVFIYSPELDKHGTTDIDGFIKWEHPKINAITIQTTSDKFFNNFFQFELINNNNSLLLPLNAIPVIDSLQFTSYYDNNGDDTFIFVGTYIFDLDGDADIKQVKFLQPKNSYKNILINDPTVSENYFTSELQIQVQDIAPDLNQNNLVEENFYLEIVNRSFAMQQADSIIYGPLSIRRVINIELNPLLPNSSNPESGSILFSWEPANLEFDFSYQIEILKSNFEILTFIENISSDSTSFNLTDQEVLDLMENDQYFWFLYTKDTLGNVCRSKFNFFNYTKN